jgi:hypothetical protein
MRERRRGRRGGTREIGASERTHKVGHITGDVDLARLQPNHLLFEPPPPPPPPPPTVGPPHPAHTPRRMRLGAFCCASLAASHPLSIITLLPIPRKHHLSLIPSQPTPAPPLPLVLSHWLSVRMCISLPRYFLPSALTRPANVPAYASLRASAPTSLLSSVVPPHVLQSATTEVRPHQHSHLPARERPHNLHPGKHTPHPAPTPPPRRHRRTHHAHTSTGETDFETESERTRALERKFSYAD